MYPCHANQETHSLIGHMLYLTDSLWPVAAYMHLYTQKSIPLGTTTSSEVYSIPLVANTSHIGRFNADVMG